MIVSKTLLTDHFNLSNREFRKKYAEVLKIIEISEINKGMIDFLDDGE